MELMATALHSIFIRSRWFCPAELQAVTRCTSDVPAPSFSIPRFLNPF